MRSSADVNDIGYNEWAANPGRWRNARIYVDGIQVRDVMTLDTGEGFVIRYKRGEDGGVIVQGEDIVTETLWGEVKVEFDG